MTGADGATPFVQVLAGLAAAAPEAVALVSGGSTMTRRELDEESSRLARVYRDHGVRSGDLVTIELPNGLDWFVAGLAAWKLGATPSPISPGLPRAEREAILAPARPALIVGVPEGERSELPSLPRGYRPGAGVSAAPLPLVVSPVERALASGGSTGRPKLILSSSPAVHHPDGPMARLFTPRACGLVPGPLYHGIPFAAAWRSLLAGATAVVLDRFDPEECLRLIQEHRVDRAWFVPTMLSRIARLPDDVRLSYDLSSLRFVLTAGAPCPAWLMRHWIEWVGPEVMHEAYGSTERLGGTFITGVEWLAHPGSVGRPVASEIKIFDPESGAELAPGATGEVYLRPAGAASTYRYVGAEENASRDGWQSLGDMGHLDDDGYLYLGDRRTDMILCRGRNIYPAEIEAALESHPRVRSSAVIGLPDDDLGQRIHAIVESEPIDHDELRGYLAERLAHYKLPKAFEFVDRPLRDDSGKVRRSALRAERLPTTSGRGEGA